MSKLSTALVIVGIVGFILFIHLIDLGSREITVTAGVAALMAFWWITEALPLSVTSLLPLIAFPLFSIIPASKISESYINSIIFLFLGGFLISIAIENWNLHKRIALKIILFFGTKPTRLLLGFMIATAFISMWISNTATALMMLPVAFAVLSKISEVNNSENLTKALLLGIAYSCSIGGIATLVGTQPNLVFVRIAKIHFPSSQQISFLDWMLFALPISLIILAFTYLLIKFIFRISNSIEENFNQTEKDLIRVEYKKLGEMNYEEKAVASVFLLTIVLWITRTEITIGSFHFIGWAKFLNLQNFVDDSTVAMFSAFLLFLIPTKNDTKSKRLLNLQAIEKVPWNVILLFGGGFALASAFTESGLSKLIGSKFNSFAHIDILLLIFIISITINFLTEMTSNTAVAQMILPVLASISITINQHPYLLMIPAALASSMAFMLPVGTPPNTIIFSSNKLKIIDMVKTGFLLNLMSTLVITLLVYFLGNAIFKLDVFPSWAK
jgi:sodium-dependent dicarboxylate transporter 2/3/5